MENSRVPKQLSPQHFLKGSGGEGGENVESPLLRYLRGSPIEHRRLSPLSPVDNLLPRSPSSPAAAFRTSVRAVNLEEVLVMDGVSVTGAGGKRSSRRSASASPSSSSSSSSGSFGKSLQKSLQFVHGKENLHPTRFHGKSKFEAQTCKSKPSSGSCTPSPKSRFAHQAMVSAVTETAAAALSPKLSALADSAAAASSLISAAVTTSPASISPPKLYAVTDSAAAASSLISAAVTTSPASISPPKLYAVTEAGAAASSPKPSAVAEAAAAASSQKSSPVTNSAAAPSSQKSSAVSKSPASSSLPKLSAATEAGAAASSPNSKSARKASITVSSSRDWSPQDDGIEVVLPSLTENPPLREDVDVYINACLYGPSRRRRLPVFADICPV